MSKYGHFWLQNGRPTNRSRLDEFTLDSSASKLVYIQTKPPPDSPRLTRSFSATGENKEQTSVFNFLISINERTEVIKSGS